MRQLLQKLKGWEEADEQKEQKDPSEMMTWRKRKVLQKWEEQMGQMDGVYPLKRRKMSQVVE